MRARKLKEENLILYDEESRFRQKEFYKDTANESNLIKSKK